MLGALSLSPHPLPPLPISPPCRRLFFSISTSALSLTPSRAHMPLHPAREPSGCRRLTGRNGVHSRCPGGRPEKGRRSGDDPALPPAPLRTKAAAGGAAAGAARAAPRAPRSPLGVRPSCSSARCQRHALSQYKTWAYARCSSPFFPPQRPVTCSLSTKGTAYPEPACLLAYFLFILHP